MKKRVLLSALAFACLGFSGTTTAAETITPDPSLNNQNRPAKLPVAPLLEEVVVTATRTTEQRRDIINSVGLFDSAAIAASTATSVGQLVSEVPGIDLRTRGNYGGASEEIHIRGMQGDATMVYLNGISINSPSLGVADLSRIPLNAVDRVEIVKGSGSLLYGSGAMAGTVSLETKKPERDITALVVSTGTATREKYHLALENGQYVTDNFGYYLTASSREASGERSNSDLTHQDVTLNLVYDRGQALNLSLYGDLIRHEYGLPGIVPPAGTQTYVVNSVPLYSAQAASLQDKGSDDDNHLVIKLASRPVDWFSMAVQGSYTDMTNYTLTMYNSTATGNKFWVTNTLKKIDAYGQFTLAPELTVVVGGDYQDQDWDTTQILMDSLYQAASGATEYGAGVFTRSVYSELQYRPSTYFKVVAGLRHENHSTFGSEALPLYGLVINPGATSAIKVSHGKHFKAPTPNDLFWPEDDFVRGNPDLKPQTGYHTDLTFEQHFLDNALFISGSYFEWSVDDKIDWAENPAYVGPFGNKWTPTNLNSSEGSGFELSASYAPTDTLKFSANYTNTSGREILQAVQRRTQYLPEHQLMADMNYRFDFDMAVTVAARYMGKRLFYQNALNDTPTHKLDSHITIDLKVEQVLLDNWLVKMTANNLLDAAYDDFIGSFADENWQQHYGMYPASGRSLWFELAFEY